MTDTHSLSYMEIDVEREEELKLIEELANSNKLVVELRERILKN